MRAAQASDAAYGRSPPRVKSADLTLNWEEAMVRLSVLASLLLSLVIPCNATSAPLAKEAEVNGVRIQYLEDGSGEPVVFVHGVISDHRAWEPVRDDIARKYRFIALTQRYFGTCRSRKSYPPGFAR